MRLDGFYITANWPDQQLTLGEFVVASLRYLGALRELHAIFRGKMYLTGSSFKEFELLAAGDANLQSFVQRFGWDRKAPKQWNTGVLPDRTMSLEGTAKSGFHLALNSSGAKSLPETMTMHLRFGGNPGGMGNLVLEFPTIGSQDFNDVGFVTKLVRATVDCLEPELLTVVDTAFRDALDDQTQCGPLSVGWLNYFDQRNVEAVLPEDLKRLPFGHHGLLTILQAKPPLATDTVALSKAAKVFDALSPGQHLTSRLLRVAKP